MPQHTPWRFFFWLLRLNHVFTWLVCCEPERVSVAGRFHPCTCNCRPLQVMICTLTCWDHQWCWRCISHPILAENPTICNVEDGRKCSTLHFMYLVLEKNVPPVFAEAEISFFLLPSSSHWPSSCYFSMLSFSSAVSSSLKKWFSCVSGPLLGDSRTPVANSGLVKSKHIYQMMYWGPKGCLEDYHCHEANQKKVLGEKQLSNKAPEGGTWIRNILSYTV